MLDIIKSNRHALLQVQMSGIGERLFIYLSAKFSCFACNCKLANFTMGICKSTWNDYVCTRIMITA
jgi:hypothetical protein